jgi:hypothetical protein
MRYLQVGKNSLGGGAYLVLLKAMRMPQQQFAETEFSSAKLKKPMNL